jgi:hypothetical protein
MNLIKEAAKLVGWLTGTLAGLVAILYACGYLIVQTQLHLLGISALLPSGRDYYLQEGANFFIVTGQKVGQLLLGLVALVLIFCIPVSILKKSPTGVKYLARLKDKCFGIQNSHQWLWQAAIFLLLVILLFFPLVNNLDMFRAPMELSGVLHTSQENVISGSLSSDAIRIQNLMTTGDRQTLVNFYYLLLMHCLFAGFLLAAALHLTATWPLKSIIAFPFLLVFTIYLFLLPLGYAVLEKNLEFPSIRFISTFDKISSNSGDLLLLDKTDQEFILWDKAQKKALWLPRDKVVMVEIGQSQPFFPNKTAKRK